MIDTIAAPITAPGHAAVSLVRVSGPLAEDVLRALVSDSDEVIRNPRKIFLRNILDTGNRDAVLDSGCVCYFAAPHSFTGEDVLEIHLHGSPFLVQRVLENLNAKGVRGARPGEFTERAFHNGKYDLAQAEAVADLIAAESAAQARVAQNQLQGKLSHAISDLGLPLRELCAEIEAHIDFPEEGIEPQSAAEWSKTIQRTLTTLSRYIDSYLTGRILRDGASVVLVGLPNAGKSSLLNAFVGDERVIVTPIPGTTRDSVEEVVTIEGLRVRLWDTAGLSGEHTPDEVEKIGMAHSWKRVRSADLLLFVIDRSADFQPQEALLNEVKALGLPLMLIGNKSDLANNRLPAEHLKEFLPVSALKGDGLEELKRQIAARLVSREHTGELLVTTARHVEALKRARAVLQDGHDGLQNNAPPEVVALLLRSALCSLEEIIGVTTTDDILGLVFSKFCIGK